VKAVCEALGIARSNLMVKKARSANWIDRRRAPPKPDDSEVLAEIESVAAGLPSYGYHRIWGVMRNQRKMEEKPAINAKRVYRIMRDHDLLLWRRGQRPKDHRRHDGKVAVAESNKRWCSDGFEVACDNGERVRIAFAEDCCDREAMSWIATTRGIDAQMVCDMMIEAVESRFGKVDTIPSEIEWLSDNGSCYTAHETTAFARQLGFKPVTTPVASPQSNGMAESLVKTLKRDYMQFAHRPDAAAVLMQLPAWFEHYNEIHPHSALKYLSPRMFRKKKSDLTSSACPV
jgi:putative transposase